MKTNKGFSLIEVIFAAVIFSMISISIYQGFTSLVALISVSRDKVVATDLINSEFELIRNLSYNDVGLQGGIPSGVLLATTTSIIDGREFLITRIIRNIDDPFDGKIGGSPNDLSPADYKMVQINISCVACKKSLDVSATANVAPKNLETASTNGALFIKVFDANGVPVPQADVHIINSAVGVDINETTDNNGLLAVVDAPPAQNSYRIVVNKDGYTTDQTYATSTTNPNPSKTDATVILQQLTQVSFVIDKVSEVNLYTINDKCAAISGVPIVMSGSKLIGSNPDVYKLINNLTTDSSGYKNISDLEWDTYSFETGSGFYLAGTNPIFPISILPDSKQNIDLVMTDGSPAFLLVAVKDASTGLPISDAEVVLSGGSNNQTLVTNQGFLKQTDWNGGAGQSDFVDVKKYFSSSGIETGNPEGELKLESSLGSYISSGVLISSIFDTGTSTNWSRVDILPSSQPTQTGSDSVKFQIATASENTATTSWNFLGPDGTAGSFYTISNNNINSVHDGDRYIRYKIFLSTEDSSYTPNISDFAISFSSDCVPPGQVLFQNLSSGNYDLEISANNFSTQNISVSVSANWQKQDVLLTP